MFPRRRISTNWPVEELWGYSKLLTSDRGKNGLDNVQRGFFGSVLTTTIRWSIIVNNCCNTASFVNALNDWSRAFQLSWLSGQRGGWKKIHVTQPQGEDVMPDREKGLELKEKPVEKSIVENQFFDSFGSTYWHLWGYVRPTKSGFGLYVDFEIHGGRKSLENGHFLNCTSVAS